MMDIKPLMSSKDMTWETPKALFNYLNARFHFTLDPCSSESNHLCPRYFTEAEDGLSKSWVGEVVYMNPPYGTQIKNWIRKAYDESVKGALVVGLIPARTDTNWWHSYIEGKAYVSFLKGRLYFTHGGKPSSTSTFPSALIVWIGLENLISQNFNLQGDLFL